MVGSFELLLAVSPRSQTGDGPYYPGGKCQQQEAAKTAALQKTDLSPTDSRHPTKKVQGRPVASRCDGLKPSPVAYTAALKRLEEGSRALQFICVSPLGYH
jgi:hypothetical protein